MRLAKALSGTLSLLRRLRFYEAVLLGFLALALGAWSLKEVTESAVFCGSTCHVMRPFYEDWKTSSHNQIPCVDCHLPPADGRALVPRFQALRQVASYLTRTYGRGTRAEVNDAACLQDQCHARRLLEGRVTFGRGTVFDHGPHLQQLRRGKILRCTTCHARVTMGGHITVSTEPCFLCHFRGQDPSATTCRQCHLPPPTGPVLFGGRFDHRAMADRSVPCEGCHSDVVQGDGAVPPEACAACHGTAPAPDSSPPEVLHPRHVTDHKVECRLCHGPVRHTLPREAVTPACGGCHEDRHRGVDLLYRGQGAEGVLPMPSPMQAARVGCRGCHTLPDRPGDPAAPYLGRTLLAPSEACAACHADDRRAALSEARAALASALARAEAALRRAEGAAGAGDDPRSVAARRAVLSARHDILFIRSSVPVHNPAYALAALRKAAEDLERVSNSEGR